MRHSRCMLHCDTNMNAYNHDAMRSITFVTAAEWKSRKASDEERQIYDAVMPRVFDAIRLH